VLKLTQKYPALDVGPQGRNFKKLSEILNERWCMLFNQKVHLNLAKPKEIPL